MTSADFPDSGGLVGRNKACDLILDDPSRFVSSRHATIAKINGAITVTDTSSNGTYINDQKDPIGRGNSVALREGDCVLIGDFRLELRSAPGDLAAPDLPPLPEDVSDDIDALLRGPSATPPPAVIGDELDALLAGPGPAATTSAATPSAYKDGDDLLGDPGSSGGPGGSTDPLAALDNAADSGQSLIGEDFDPGLDELLGGPRDSLAGAPAQRDDQAAVDQQFSAPAAIPDSWDPLTDSGDDLAGLAPPPASRQNSGSALDDLLAPAGVSDIARQATESAAAPVPPSVAPQAAAEAVTIANPPVAAPAPQASPGADQALLSGLLRGMGMSRDDLLMDDPERLGERLGAALRESIGAVMHVLKARTQVKSEFRIAQTQLMPTANNPLKFSIDAKEAIVRFFGAQQRGYMNTAESLAQAQRDIQNHEVATLYGMRAAMVAIVGEFSPDIIEQKVLKDGGRGILPGSQATRCWQRYCDRYQDLSAQDFEDLHRRFSEAFGKSYHGQIHKLESR